MLNIISVCVLFLFDSPHPIRHFDPTPCHSFPLWDFMITLIGHSSLGRTSLDTWSAWCRDLYLTIYNTHKRWTSILLVGIEPTIPASEWPQTHTLDCVATGIGSSLYSFVI